MLAHRKCTEIQKSYCVFSKKLTLIFHEFTAEGKQNFKRYIFTGGLILLMFSICNSSFRTITKLFLNSCYYKVQYYYKKNMKKSKSSECQQNCTDFKHILLHFMDFFSDFGVHLCVMYVLNKIKTGKLILFHMDFFGILVLKIYKSKVCSVLRRHTIIIYISVCKIWTILDSEYRK